MAIDINIPSQVKSYANLAGFPATGSLKTIFIAEDTNKTYRWTGSAYVEVSGVDLSGYVPTTRTLTINGTTQDLSADRTFTISTGITIGTTAITSGTVGRVLFQGAGNVVQQSSSLFWDSTNNRLGIGTSSPLARQHILTTSDQPLLINTSGNIEVAQFFGSAFVSTENYAGFRIIATTNGVPYIGLNTSSNVAGNVVGSQKAYIGYWGDDFGFASVGYSNGTHAIAWSTTTGNVKIGGVSNGKSTFTDAGFKLDVNGTARVNTLTIGLGTGQIATNSVLGYQGLFSNTTGAQNIAIGYQSVYTNTTGSGNVGVGVSSLVFNISGSGNSAFGDESLLRNTTGARNIAIGQRAGTYAGSGTTSNQTSSDSIYIGYQARASASGATNELVFGKDTVGSGSNTATLGNTSIVDTILRGRINLQQYATGSRPTYVKGALIYDSTLSKLVVGGASGWEVVTSI